MSHAQQQIAQLDRLTASRGETVSYQPPGKEFDAGTFRCVVRNYKPGELQGGLKQGDSEVIVSPTALAGNVVIELRRGGRLVINGSPRYIETAEPVKLDDVIVRYNLWVRG